MSTKKVRFILVFCAVISWFIAGFLPVVAEIKNGGMPSAKEWGFMLLCFSTVGAILLSDTTRTLVAIMWAALMSLGIFTLVFGVMLQSTPWLMYETLFPGVTQDLVGLIVPGFFGLLMIFIPDWETQDAS
ncbi:hypothetical protein GYA27_01115 [candidate division WWE3 bacterium]|uniref:Uncharacterized protein n=1 Tax=candidate division WWE3 bacterium TaxID=2053526 RepID=A0A7X9HHP7_UNCKA|nr:hypothetical protein [candidate division WWE3 bacterium]